MKIKADDLAATVEKTLSDYVEDVNDVVKQEIKDDLFGEKRVAIEVFPAAKNLVDICDVYHLWVLPKDFKLPFGIHPTRDSEGFPVQRGYDFDVEATKTWCDSPVRKALEGETDD